MSEINQPSPIVPEESLPPKVKHDRPTPKIYWIILLVVGIFVLAVVSYAVWCGQKDIIKTQTDLPQVMPSAK